MEAFNGVFPKALSGLMEENYQTRIRGTTLMSFSNRYGHLVLSTGNKSELSVGFCTQYGDTCGGLAPISDCYKMEVYAMAKYRNQIAGKDIIPQVIINKEPSAELSPGQLDTDSLPPYPVLDGILKFLIEGDTLSGKDYEKELARFLLTYDIKVIQKIVKLVQRAEFKRRQAAFTIKMHEKAFGYGRRVPVAQKWLEYSNILYK
jgi:NAD+ synthetase